MILLVKERHYFVFLVTSRFGGYQVSVLKQDTLRTIFVAFLIATLVFSQIKRWKPSWISAEQGKLEDQPEWSLRISSVQKPLFQCDSSRPWAQKNICTFLP